MGSSLQFLVQNAKPAALPAPPRTAVPRNFLMIPIVEYDQLKISRKNECVVLTSSRRSNFQSSTKGAG